ncbi:hypothetical protein [Abyssisolibacter fermentans]|nr:hypothetical protein [Abyssisolibacter fermentans]
MSNHVHLLIKEGEESISMIMHELGQAMYIGTILNMNAANLMIF